MTYVVNENCIRCKTMDCVEVCPVDCFYEGENMLVINPDECIDCSVCVPECPVDAIKPDTEPGLEKWLSLNAEYQTPAAGDAPIRFFAFSRGEKGGVEVQAGGTLAELDPAEKNAFSHRARAVRELEARLATLAPPRAP